MRTTDRRSNRQQPLRKLLIGLTLGFGLTMVADAQSDGGLTVLQSQLAGKVVGIGAAPVALARPGTAGAAAVQVLLQQPLTADSAVRVALLNNPDLQMQLAADGPDVSDIGSALSPAKRRAQQKITTLSAQAFKAWVNAVATAQAAQDAEQAKATAEASGELMRRMTRVGNQSKLAQARSQLLLSDAAMALASAQREAFLAREALSRSLGLWGAQAQYQLPPQLPALPNAPIELPDVESMALGSRADLALARDQWDRQRRSQSPRTPDERWDAFADEARILGQAIEVRSRARETYYRYRSSYELAQHLRQEVLPLHKFIGDEMLLRYNGMLESAFELLAANQAQTTATAQATLAARNFWWAQADLQALLAGAPNAGGDAPATSMTRASANAAAH